MLRDLACAMAGLVMCSHIIWVAPVDLFQATLVWDCRTIKGFACVPSVSVLGVCIVNL